MARLLMEDTALVLNDSLHGCADDILSENARCTLVSPADAHHKHSINLEFK